MSTLHCALENGADLYVNERQKIRHYESIALLKKEEERECQIAIFYFTRCERKLRYYSDVIHSLDWKSAIEHDVVSGPRPQYAYVNADIGSGNIVYMFRTF